MSRAIYVKPEHRIRLFRNALVNETTPKRNRCLVLLLYGLPLRPVEISKIPTRHFVDENRNVKKQIGDGLLRANLAYNEKARPIPDLTDELIAAIEDCLDERVRLGWGLIGGDLDMDVPFFLKDKNNGFKVNKKIVGGKATYTAKGLLHLITQLHKENEIEGNSSSALRTWTLDQRADGKALDWLWMMRGDTRLQTVVDICKRHPFKHAKLIEKFVEK